MPFPGVVILKPVDIVIPVADKNDKITKKCLAHLERTQKYPYNVILIEDRGPSFSFGKSVNVGISQASSDLVIGMDSDAFPEPDAIEKLLKFAENYSHVGYFGVRIRHVGFGNGYGESLGWIYSNSPLDLMRQAWRTKAPIFYLKELIKRGSFY